MHRKPGQLGRNIISGAVGQAGGIAITVVTTPILVHGLGVADYGLWIVTGAVSSWVGVVNLVISTSGIRFVGQALGRGDARGAHEAHRALKGWATVCAVVGAAVISGLAPWLAHKALHVEPHKVDVAIMALFAQAVLVFCQIQAAVGSGIVIAHQRLDIAYGLLTGGTLLQSGGAAVVVLLGHGVVAVSWWVAAVQGLMWMAFSWWARYLQPSIATPVGGVDLLAWGRRLMGYSWAMLVGCAATQLFVPTGRILVGVLRPLAEVAYFSVPANLASTVGSFANHVAFSVMPAASEKAGQSDLSGLRHLYLRGLRWSWLTLIPVTGLLLALGGRLISVWIGPEFGRQAGPLMTPLVLGLGFATLGGVAGSVAQGMGRPVPWAVITLGTGLMNVAVGALLIPHRGAQGAAEAMGVAGALFALGMLGWAGRVLRVDWQDYRQALDLRVIVVTGIVTSGLALWASRLDPRLATVVALGVVGALLILAVAPWWLPAEERAWLTQKWRSIWLVRHVRT